MRIGFGITLFLLLRSCRAGFVGLTSRMLLSIEEVPIQTPHPRKALVEKCLQCRKTACDAADVGSKFCED